MVWGIAEKSEANTERGCVRVKIRMTIAAVSMAVAVAASMPATADVKSPGQCKKQGPSDCSGQSECHGPHFELLPNGQQKKC
jgi:hypothetical protein